MWVNNLIYRNNMKKTIVNLFSLLAVLSTVSMSVSCEREQQIEETSFALADGNEFNISSEGGSLQIGYGLDNPGTNPSVTAESEAEWLSLEVMQDAVSVEVEENSGETPREAMITVAYSDDEGTTFSYEVTLKQDALEMFRISSDEQGSTWKKYSVSPRDPSMKYMVFVRKADEMANFASDEELFKADMAEYQGYADSYGMTLMELILEYNLYRSGEILDQYMTLLQPETEYRLYCYGITDEPSMSTAVYGVDFKTTEIVSVDNQFTIDIPEDRITDAEAFVSITPSTMDSYTMAVFTTEGIADDQTIIDFLASGTLGMFAGYEEYQLFEQPNTSYTVVVMGLAGNTPTTGLFKKEFKTKESTGGSDELSVEVQTKLFDGDEVAVHIEYPDAQGKLVLAQKTLSDGFNVWSTLLTKAEYDSLYDEVVADPDFTGTTDSEIHVAMVNEVIESGSNEVRQDWSGLWFLDEEGEYVAMSVVSDFFGEKLTADAVLVEVNESNVSPISEYDSFMDMRPVSGLVFPRFK